MAKSSKTAPKKAVAEKTEEAPVTGKVDLGAKRATAKAKERAITDAYAKENSAIMPDGYPIPDATTTVKEEVKEQAEADGEAAEGGNIGSSEVVKPGTGS